MRNYQLTPDQRRRFSRRGFLLLPRAFPDRLVQRWRELADTLEKQALEAHRLGRHQGEFCVVEDPAGPRVMRYDNLFCHAPELLLETLASPAMMALARELCGPGAVPLHADLLYKHQHPHPVSTWHQGAQHDRRFPYLNVGLYLDDAAAGDGCLRYLPATQHKRQPIESLSERYGWEPPGVVEQPARRGDILVQDMMILHGSQPKRSPGGRRTLYVEIRPWQAVLEGHSQSPAWTELRRQWMSQVIVRADRADWPRDWEHYPALVPSLSALVAATRARWEPPLPAVSACRDVDHPDYPIPSELRAPADPGNSLHLARVAT
ncbi:phytanoyl-CoA dioxygenase family protein [Ferrimonas sediminicola]|uniref:Phytanoyl-CoA dioxygenase family protein n=1 Tax=Ferrimonas sediminicola TaxID=2569538 RepID=A0A4U1BIB5_9GAMM|nr:phytanoyl-CoA dioxygenase family protein [Ferrimonas sediminicola]TKB50289.1 phytanoyl-CoA dioxygenase family protein [Ferrimonas sediminicola]